MPQFFEKIVCAHKLRMDNMTLLKRFEGNSQDSCHEIDYKQLIGMIESLTDGNNSNGKELSALSKKFEMHVSRIK